MKNGERERAAFVAKLGFACLALLTVSVCAAAAHAQNLFDRPAGLRFNDAKLAKIGAFFENEIAQGKIPGAMVLIRQNGRDVLAGRYGVRDVKTKLPMTDDTIFRLHSMSKVITSAAAMLLVEDGRLKLDEPVATYIPSFARLQVGVEQIRDNGDRALVLAPPRRAVTVRDLMLHISGITYGFYGDSLARKTIGAANIYAGDFDNAEFAERIARLPLAEQPGTLWDYGLSTDVLGRVIEVASGQSLLAFERERLFAPLGMTQTRYFVTDAADTPRIANPLPSDADFKVGTTSQPDLFKRWESGGGGLVTTMADFARFAQMLLDGGKVGDTAGDRALMTPETFAEMTRDQVGPGSGIARDYYYFPGDGFGFGLGFGVRMAAGEADPPPPGSLGELKWDGASGCYFFIDRKQGFYVVLLQQTPSERQRIQQTLKKLVYEALE